MYTEHWDLMKRRAQFQGDQGKRRRFSAHKSYMLQEGRPLRSAEARAAYKADKGGYDSGAWHTYIFKGGNRPGDGSGGSGPPEMGGEAPELNLPEYDDREVSSLAQKKAAPGVRRLRNVTQQALSSSHENPNVQRMTVRDALAGYGTGLESVMAGAERSAAGQYGQQYAASVNAEMSRFDAANRKQMQAFDISSKAWLMERQYQLKDEYEDPYEAFNSFYGGSGGGSRGSRGSSSGGNERQAAREERNAAWNARPFSRER